MTTPLPAMLKGIIPPLVTPLKERDRLDVAALERLIGHVLGGGVHGLFILGTTGEAAALASGVKRELVERVCRLACGRVPVLVGVPDTCVARSIELARFSAQHGAAAIVVSPSFFLPPNQEELLSYVRRLVGQQPLPIILYNLPSLTRTAFEPATVATLAEMPKVVGIKDSSGEIDYVSRIRAAVPRADFSVMVGIEGLIARGMALGAVGGVPAGGNVLPRLFVDWYETTARGDAQKSAELEERVQRFGRIYNLGTGLTPIIRGVKCALALMGICSDHMAEPFLRYGDSERQVVRECLAELGLI